MNTPIPPGVVGKASAMITREGAAGRELLVFRHPTAGIQLPGGTMEDGETPEATVLREVREETGLTDVSIVALLDADEYTLQAGNFMLLRPYPLLTAPDGDASQITLTRGYPVRALDRAGEYVRVSYEFIAEDGVLRPDLRKVGWLPRHLLTINIRRHLFHLMPTAPSPERWLVDTDGRTFALFWMPLVGDEGLIPVHQEYLDRMRDRLADEDATRDPKNE